VSTSSAFFARVPTIAWCRGEVANNSPKTRHLDGPMKRTPCSRTVSRLAQRPRAT
jgi:hypothetical protein